MAIASDETAELTGSFVQDDFPFLIFFMNMCNNFEHPIEETSSEHPQKALLSTCSILCRYPLVRNQISSYGMILWKQRHTLLISRDFPMNIFIFFPVIAQLRNPSFLVSKRQLSALRCRKTREVPSLMSMWNMLRWVDMYILYIHISSYLHIIIYLEIYISILYISFNLYIYILLIYICIYLYIYTYIHIICIHVEHNYILYISIDNIQRFQIYQYICKKYIQTASYPCIIYIFESIHLHII